MHEAAQHMRGGVYLLFSRLNRRVVGERDRIASGGGVPRQIRAHGSPADCEHVVSAEGGCGLDGSNLDPPLTPPHLFFEVFRNQVTLMVLLDL